MSCLSHPISCLLAFIQLTGSDVEIIEALNEVHCLQLMSSSHSCMRTSAPSLSARSLILKIAQIIIISYDVTHFNYTCFNTKSDTCDTY
ncbi:hypothetical protein EB796_015127 [Bugula neritina]|uniref:Uncharacterized protein n=1 Tax=Bugula neritina TaxID=10212 RepID=A0A7J7JLR7_BUGNE|nr:hypothetical protein EB796_015127 [Bugula neritina]